MKLGGDSCHCGIKDSIPAQLPPKREHAPGGCEPNLRGFQQRMSQWGAQDTPPHRVKPGTLAALRESGLGLRNGLHSGEDSEDAGGRWLARRNTKKK